MGNLRSRLTVQIFIIAFSSGRIFDLNKNAKLDDTNARKINHTQYFGVKTTTKKSKSHNCLSTPTKTSEKQRQIK